MKRILFLLLFAYACTPAPSLEQRATVLIQAEIEANSWGVLVDQPVTLEAVNDSTFIARYTVPSGAKVKRTFFFDKNVQTIKHIEN